MSGYSNIKPAGGITEATEIIVATENLGIRNCLQTVAAHEYAIDTHNIAIFCLSMEPVLYGKDQKKEENKRKKCKIRPENPCFNQIYL